MFTVAGEASAGGEVCAAWRRATATSSSIRVERFKADENRVQVATRHRASRPGHRDSGRVHADCSTC